MILVLLVCSNVQHNAAVAQTAAERRDSLERLRSDIAEFNERIALADSAHDAKESARQRIMLAALVKRVQAIKLLQEAALIADTAALPGDEELRARRGLIELYKASGDWRKAFDEAQRTMVLSGQFAAREAMSLVDAERMNTSAMLGERDFAMNTLAEERAKFEAEAKAAEQRGQRWMWVALGIGALFLITLLLVLWRSGRSNQRIRTELDSLRSEVTTLKEQRVLNRIRIEPPAEVLPVAPIVVSTPVPVPEPAPLAAIDPVVLAMFQKMVPERLATLRDARARGDHEKVVRVVRTLKPQLVAMDAAGFGDLCATITAEGASLISQRWNSDLDRFERAVERLMV